MDINETIERFGYPETLVAEFAHWVVLLRPSQPTLGSLILAARGPAKAFSQLPEGAHAELRQISSAIERALQTLVSFERLNYLMLMMVDPHVHFHVIPRYEGSRSFDGLTLEDTGWPGPPDLKSAQALDHSQLVSLTARLRGLFVQPT